MLPRERASKSKEDTKLKLARVELTTRPHALEESFLLTSPGPSGFCGVGRRCYLHCVVTNGLQPASGRPLLGWIPVTFNF